MILAMANAPALLRGYVDLTAMKRSHIDRRISERILLAVHEWLGCAYCVEAHRHAARALGLSEDEISLARHGTATDSKTAPIVAFGQQVGGDRGQPCSGLLLGGGAEAHASHLGPREDLAGVDKALPASEGEQREHHRAGGRDSSPPRSDASHSANACAPFDAAAVGATSRNTLLNDLPTLRRSILTSCSERASARLVLVGTRQAVIKRDDLPTASLGAGRGP